MKVNIDTFCLSVMMCLSRFLLYSTCNYALRGLKTLQKQTSQRAELTSALEHNFTFLIL